MRAKKVTDLFDGLAVLSKQIDLEVTGVSTDSRNAKSGDLFLACRGAKFHGLEFVADVIDRGVRAVAWEPSDAYSDKVFPQSDRGVLFFPVVGLSRSVSKIAARFYDHPSKNMTIVGITGTDGKTSCSYFLAHALRRLTKTPCGLIGTLGSGQAGALKSNGYTTPNAIVVQTLLAEMSQQKMNHVAMEVSSHALDQGRVSGVEFSVVALTNLTRDHLDYHGTPEAYREAKQKLFFYGSNQHHVLNIDDKFGQSLYEMLPNKTKIITYGFNRHADVCGYDLEHSAEGISLKVITPSGGGEVSANLIGDFNASNLLCVISILLSLGYSWEAAFASLDGVRSVPGRMECFRVPGKPVAVVDFAHTPNALSQVLRAVRPYATKGSVWVVFGCGGDRDHGKRPEMGEAAFQWADRLIVTSDNPRSEDPQAIIQDVLSGIPAHDNVVVEPDRAKAIAYALTHAGENDVVLVAGKGHETTQILADRTIPFDDCNHVRQIMEGA